MYPAAPNQIRHWRHARRFPESPALNMTVALMLEGRVDVQALRHAAFDAVRRHDSLIARPFETEDGLFFRRHEADFSSVEHVEVSEHAREEDALHALRAEAARAFSLEHEAPTRVRVVRLDETRCVLVLNVHHIALDGWSVDILVREISALYASRRAGSSGALPPPPSYGPYVKYQQEHVNGVLGARDRAYFLEELRGARVGVGFIPDGPRKGATWPRGQMTWARFSKPLSDGIRAVAGEHGATPFAPLVGTFAKLCAKATGEADVLLGVPFANRLRAEHQNLVGFVVNTLPLRFNGFDRSNADFLAAAAQTARRGFVHQRLPFIEILRDMGAELASGESPAFRTMFILQSSQSARTPIGDLRTRQAWVSTGGAKYDQTWTVEERDGAYTLDVEWNPDLFTEAFVRAQMVEYAGMLQALVAELAPAAHTSSERPLEWPVLDDLAGVFSGPIVLERRAS